MRKSVTLLLGVLMLLAGCIMTGCKKQQGQTVEIPEGYVAEGANALVPSEQARMFDPDGEVNYIYNYCPSVMQTSENERHVYYCSNLYDRVGIDAIAYRHGLKKDGVWFWSKQSIVLTPFADSFDWQSFDWENVNHTSSDFESAVPWDNGAWDRRHVCDPSVVKGTFAYNGENYSYLMAYLGCYVADRDNEIGLAVAKSPAGPWKKIEIAADPAADKNHIEGLVSTRNPWTRSNRAFIEFDGQFEDYYATDEARIAGAWGVGQPSVVSVDKQGKVLLFYTVGGVSRIQRVMVERWDLSDLNKPVREERDTLTMRGVTEYGSAKGTWACTNSDLGYDPGKNRFYIIGDGFPFPDDIPTYIAQYSYVGYMDNLTGTDSVLGDRFFKENKQTARWNEVDFIDEYLTGFPRNHNCGLVTDAYGWLPNPDTLEVGVTASTSGSDFGYTYRISRYVLDIRD